MTNLRRSIAVLATALSGAALANTSEAQRPQREIAQQLLHGNVAERSRAVERARTIAPNEMDAELRSALISSLEDEGQLDARRRRGEVGVGANPELVARLAHVVAGLRDERAIPSLVGALATSPPAVHALARFGEAAAPALIDMATQLEDPYVVTGALIALRLMIEQADERPLTRASLERIAGLAKQRLGGTQEITTLWRAIDLAVAIGDPTLRVIVETLAAEPAEVASRGVNEPSLIQRTQRRAAERLAGVPALPRPRQHSF